jgi:hypothetical protein
MVLSTAAKAARAAVTAAIKRKKANITTKRKKYPGLEKKLRKHNLQKARDQRHGQTHRQLTGPRPVTSDNQTGKWHKTPKWWRPINQKISDEEIAYVKETTKRRTVGNNYMNKVLKYGRVLDEVKQERLDFLKKHPKGFWY